MTELLPPLTPPDCELQDFKFMPLDVARLRSSEQNSDVTPEANWAALQLWAASWHEVPAGSIPDNDTWQAKAAGYVSRGTVDQRWGDIREGALRKFVKCSDGRLYHPVVCEKALDAWASKLEQRWRSECGRIKKHNQRHELKGENAVAAPTYEAWIAAGRPTGQPLPVPKDTMSMSQGRPRGQGVQGRVKGQGQGLDKNPTGSIAAAAPRGTKRVPESFNVTPELIQWAAENAPNVDWKAETDSMRDWEYAKPHSDWPAAWRTWMRRAQKAHAEGRSTNWKKPELGETPYQRSQRETVHAFTGGLASKRLPAASSTPSHLETVDADAVPRLA